MNHLTPSYHLEGDAMKQVPHQKHLYHLRRADQPCEIPVDQPPALPQDEVAVLVQIDNAEVVADSGVKGPHTFWIKVNMTRPLCDALLGEHHSAKHRMLAGVGFMAIGVFIAKVAGHSPTMLISALGDCFGYALHGLGLTPFIEHLADLVRKRKG